MEVILQSGEIMSKWFRLVVNEGNAFYEQTLSLGNNDLLYTWSGENDVKFKD